MFISPESVLSILEHYKYFLIFPVAIVEGPIIIVITGFLVFLGYLNPYVALPVVIVADILGDTIYYTIGKFWKKSPRMKKIAKFFGYDENSEMILEEHFRNHKGKTLLLSKVSHGIGGAVQVSSGIAGVKYPEFLKFSVLGTIPKAVLLFCVGYYAGNYYLKIDNFLDYIALVTLSLVIIMLVYLFAARYARNYLTNKE